MKIISMVLLVVMLIAMCCSVMAGGVVVIGGGVSTSSPEASISVKSADGSFQTTQSVADLKTKLSDGQPYLYAAN